MMTKLECLREACREACGATPFDAADALRGRKIVDAAMSHALADWRQLMDGDMLDLHVAQGDMAARALRTLGREARRRLRQRASR